MTHTGRASVLVNGYPEQAPGTDVLSDSYRRALPGLQVMEYCEITVSDTLPEDHPYFPGASYEVSPYYPHKVDTSDGISYHGISVFDKPGSREKTFRAVMTGFPSESGLVANLVGRDLLPISDSEAENRAASVLDAVSENTRAFLDSHPEVVRALGAVNDAPAIGRQRSKALRALAKVTSRAIEA